MVVSLNCQTVTDMNNQITTAQEITKEFYIEYLSRKNNFQRTYVEFDSMEEAAIWGRENLGHFNSDMVKINDDFSNSVITTDYQITPTEAIKMLDIWKSSGQTKNVELCEALVRLGDTIELAVQTVLNEREKGSDLYYQAYCI